MENVMLLDLECEVGIKLMTRLKYVDNVRVFEDSLKVYLAHHTPKGIKYYVVKDLESLASIWFPKNVKRLTKEMLAHLQEFKD